MKLQSVRRETAHANIDSRTIARAQARGMTMGDYLRAFPGLGGKRPGRPLGQRASETLEALELLEAIEDQIESGASAESTLHTCAIMADLGRLVEREGSTGTSEHEQAAMHYVHSASIGLHELDPVDRQRYERSLMMYVLKHTDDAQHARQLAAAALAKKTAITFADELLLKRNEHLGTGFAFAERGQHINDVYINIGLHVVSDRPPLLEALHPPSSLEPCRKCGSLSPPAPVLFACFLAGLCSSGGCGVDGGQGGWLRQQAQEKPRPSYPASPSLW